MQIEVVHGDALTLPGDVLVLFMHVDFGLGGKVLRLLNEREAISASEVERVLRLTNSDESVLVRGGPVVSASEVLFVGARGVASHRYADIVNGVSRAMASLARLAPACRHLLLTVPGSGIGLDEGETFKSALFGLRSSLSTGTQYPPDLLRVSFVEHSLRRAARFANMLELSKRTPPVPVKPVTVHRTSSSATPSPPLPITLPPTGSEPKSHAVLKVPGPAEAALDSGLKPHAFVAMPFSPALDDLYFYGIQSPVNAAGLLCERADHAHFTGDILTYIKDRIGSAAVVIAEMTEANANVYLEVGYAWGQSRSTLLLTKDTGTLKFDVRGQRHLQYSSIRELEDKLARELKAMRSRTNGW